MNHIKGKVTQKEKESSKGENKKQTVEASAAVKPEDRRKNPNSGAVDSRMKRKPRRIH